MNSTDPPPRSSYGRHAFVGMAFVGGAMLVGKLASVGAQVILGWVLVKEDYKLWGLAISMNILIAGLRDSGTSRILIQRGKEVADLAGPMFKFSWIFNFSAALALVAISPVAQWFYEEPKLPPLMWLMGVAIALNSPGVIHRARLAIDLKFKAIARINAISSVITYGSMAIFGVCGFGAYSFVLPQIVTALAIWILFRWCAGSAPKGLPLTWLRFKDIFAAGKWIMLAAFATSLATSGDYLVIGRCQKQSLGFYTFGFQLTVAISGLLVAGIMQVMLPSFSKLVGDPQRQRVAFQKSCNQLMLLTVPGCIAMMLLGPALIHLVWAGMWDNAIPVFQIIVFNLIFRLLNPMSISLLQSRGRWRMYTLFMMIEGLGVLLSAYVGTQLGGLVTIAISVCICRSIIELVFFIATSKVAGIRPTVVLTEIARFLLPWLAIGGLIWWGCHAAGFDGDWAEQSTNVWYDLGVKAAAFGLVAAAMIFTLYRSETSQLLAMIRRRK